MGKEREGNSLSLADAELFVPAAKDINQDGPRSQEEHAELSAEPSTNPQAADSGPNRPSEAAEFHPTAVDAPRISPSTGHEGQDTQSGSQATFAQVLAASTRRTESDGNTFFF